MRSGLIFRLSTVLSSTSPMLFPNPSVLTFGSKLAEWKMAEFFSCTDKFLGSRSRDLGWSRGKPCVSLSVPHQMKVCCSVQVLRTLWSEVCDARNILKFAGVLIVSSTKSVGRTGGWQKVHNCRSLHVTLSRVDQQQI